MDPLTAIKIVQNVSQGRTNEESATTDQGQVDKDARAFKAEFGESGAPSGGEKPETTRLSTPLTKHSLVNSLEGDTELTPTELNIEFSEDLATVDNTLIFPGEELNDFRTTPSQKILVENIVTESIPPELASITDPTLPSHSDPSVQAVEISNDFVLSEFRSSISKIDANEFPNRTDIEIDEPRTSESKPFIQNNLEQKSVIEAVSPAPLLEKSKTVNAPTQSGLEGRETAPLDAETLTSDFRRDPIRSNINSPVETAPSAAISNFTSVNAPPSFTSDTPLITVGSIENGALSEVDLQRTITKSVQATSFNATSSVDAARQVIAAISNDRSGKTIDVRLDPPDLGRVRVQFNMETTEAVTAIVSSERGETLDLLRRHGNDLVRALEEAGFENVQLDFSSSNQHVFTSEEAADVEVFENGNERKVVYLSMDDNNRLDRLV